MSSGAGGRATRVGVVRAVDQTKAPVVIVLGDRFILSKDAARRQETMTNMPALVSATNYINE